MAKNVHVPNNARTAYTTVAVRWAYAVCTSQQINNVHVPVEYRLRISVPAPAAAPINYAIAIFFESYFSFLSGVQLQSGGHLHLNRVTKRYVLVHQIYYYVSFFFRFNFGTSIDGSLLPIKSQLFPYARTFFGTTARSPVHSLTFSSKLHVNGLTFDSGAQFSWFNRCNY